MTRLLLTILAFGLAAGLLFFEFVSDGEYLGLPSGIGALLIVAALNVPERPR